MATIEEKRRWRFELLRVLYEEVDGVPRRRDVDYRTLGPKVGLTDPDLRNAVQWLVDNGMAEWVALGGSLGITPEGVNAVEESVTSDAQVHIEVATTAEVQIVERFLGELRRLDDELAAAREERAVIDAERVALERSCGLLGPTRASCVRLCGVSHGQHRRQAPESLALPRFVLFSCSGESTSEVVQITWQPCESPSTPSRICCGGRRPLPTTSRKATFCFVGETSRTSG